ncbi:ankyrin repeat protein [Dictyocaulus viviparus]|uniref:Ankyrin repeat protein n=1 Tax=Dictyocaulus viviparus TaxID=29172 RepID=A0A0D8XE10_DICVI|nr:ankyrin repeat protein [Dictyocaulus viviparus]
MTIDSTSKRIQIESALQPLFNLDQFFSQSDLEDVFIGREWAFREIYESAIVDKIPITIVEGCRGSGKTTIFNQLILNSSFYSSKTSDTIDSGYVADDTKVWNSRNYEWMRAIASRLVAFHICNIQSSSSCLIPEFVCNLAAWLSRSPILKSYTEILNKVCFTENITLLWLRFFSFIDKIFKDKEKLELLKLEECIKNDALYVFRTAIADPLLQLNCFDQGCLVILIDGSDEAEFHRSEDGKSIDDVPLNERVVRDNRMFTEYRLSVLPELDDYLVTIRSRRSIIDPFGDLVDRIVYAANGNILYIRLLLCSPSIFARAVPVLNVMLAALHPMDRFELLAVLNSLHSDVAIMETQLDEILTILSPLLRFASNGSITLHDTAFRDWLLTNANHPKFPSDARHGHMLIAFRLTEISPLDSIQIFELAHHLLKAHPYKYMHGKYIPEYTSTKDGQIQWIKRCSKNIENVLLNHRNMFFPNTKVTQLLLMAGADVNALDPSSTITAMQEAVMAGNAQLVSLFLSNGGDVHQSQGLSVLTIAAKYGHIELLPLIFPLDNMETVESALVEGARSGHAKVIRYLLAQTWSNTKQKLVAVENALIAAAGAGETKVCELLVDSYELQDFSNAMRAACEHGCSNTVQFFLSRGVSLSSFSWPAERPALICAVESGSWDFVVAVLSLANCNIECEDPFGRTPLITAARCTHVGLIDLLLNKGRVQIKFEFP